MMKKLKALVTPKQEKKDFSSLFNRSSAKERTKFMEEVTRKANQDQRALLEKYEQSQKPA
ncbi:MAG: hypothetical protein AAB410_04130 [Patescibacteria group bacterium]